MLDQALIRPFRTEGFEFPYDRICIGNGKLRPKISVIGLSVVRMVDLDAGTDIIVLLAVATPLDKEDQRKLPEVLRLTLVFLAEARFF